jgi:hypothetical protein
MANHKNKNQNKTKVKEVEFECMSCMKVFARIRTSEANSRTYSETEAEILTLSEEDKRDYGQSRHRLKNSKLRRKCNNCSEKGSWRSQENLREPEPESMINAVPVPSASTAGSGKTVPVAASTVCSAMTPTRYGCKACELKFTSLDEFNEHCNQTHSKLVQTLDALTMGNQIPAGTVGKVFKCTICEKLILGTDKSLLAHIVQHAVSNEEEPFECPVCFVLSTDLPSYVLHTQMHQTSDSDMKGPVIVKVPFRFKCNICNQRFLQKIQLLDHVTVHQRAIFVEKKVKGNVVLKLNGGRVLRMQSVKRAQSSTTNPIT